MIRLKPNLETLPRQCPDCGAALRATDWLITGMRNLADFACAGCGSEFYGDLPAGQALFTPILLDKKSAAVGDDFGAAWFSDWLIEGYKKRSNEPLGFAVKRFSPTKNKVVLLNCLDALYGHSLLKLLNAQHHIDRQPDSSLIVLLPKFLEWMLPAGAAEAWIVDLPLRRGVEWNDWLAGEIRRRTEPFAEVRLSAAFSHPHSADFDIQRFTRVEPFPFEKFAENRNNPIVTFIWRADRLWEVENQSDARRFAKIKRRLGLSQTNVRRIREQTGKVVGFAESLREIFPALDFAVAGIGAPGDLPGWIADLRLTALDAAAERCWCERYAASHLVAGVHGSNMLLPSAHAGAVVEIIGAERWGNYLQDILFRLGDAREMFFRYRFVPHEIAPADLARLAASVLRYEDFRRLMSPEFCRHPEKYGENYDFERWLSAPKK